MTAFLFPRFSPVSLTFSALALTIVGAVLNAAPPWRMGAVSARNLASGFAAEPIAGETLRPAERSFLTKATETSRQTVRLAEVGLGQANNSELRSHAHQLATDYRRLGDALEALIRRKGGIAGAPVGGPSETYQKLAAKSGDTFDRDFVRATSDLNTGVLTLFEQAASEAKDADVREFAAAQLPVLRAHRTAITELKKTLD
jgi:putative membrane protein